MFPKDTDPRRTYKWRCLETFLAKMDEYQLDLPTAYRVIDAMVDHAHLHNLLRQRGLSILSSASLIEIGHKSITREHQDQSGIIEVIKKDIDFIKQYPDRLTALLRREVSSGGPNILKWHMRGELSSGFLAISKACQLAMHQLTPLERSMLPSRLRLLELRGQCTATVLLKYRLKFLFGNDWGVTC